MITAQEAKQRTNEVINGPIIKEIGLIEVQIESHIVLGKRAIESIAISPQVQAILKEAGYSLEYHPIDGSRPEDEQQQFCKISW